MAMDLEVVSELEDCEDVLDQTFLERLPRTFMVRRPAKVLYELCRESLQYLDEVSDMRKCKNSC
jgi:hypothetical protein